MAARYVLAVDAGTSSVKALVADLAGRPLATAQAPWSYYTPPGAPELAREFHPEGFWALALQVMGQALAQAKVPAGDIAAVGVTSQRQALVFLDRAGRELYAGPNIDLRAVFEGAALEEELGEELFRVTGHLPAFFFAPAKIRWFQSHCPRVLEQTAHILTMADWLVYRLTGELATEASLLGEAGLLDVAKREPAHRLLAHLGLSPALLPPMTPAGAKAGTNRPQEGLSLPKGTPVVSGGADTQCGLLGMGILQPGQVGAVAGWSVTLQAVTALPCFAPNRSTWTGCHLEEDRWVSESNAGDGGNAYRWLHDLLVGPGREGFRELEEAAQGQPVGAEGAMAFLGSGTPHMARLGLRPGGFLIPVPVASANLGRGHLVRAALEGLACGLRASWEHLQQTVPSQKLSRPALGGGLTRNRTWAQIVAEVLGQEIALSLYPHVSLRGAALAAAVAAGGFASLAEAAATASEGLEPLEPHPQRAAEYDALYHRWVSLNTKLEALQGDLLG